jgi:rubrerythrin
VSRIPRFQEHLKTGFAAEAASAARFRAYAARAERDGLPNLARRWDRLAAAKDELAMALLEAADQVRGEDTDLADALAEERFENDVLYPKMIRDLDPKSADPLLRVVAAQKEHLRELEAVRQALTSSQGDIAVPSEVATPATHA